MWPFKTKAIQLPAVPERVEPPRLKRIRRPQGRRYEAARKNRLTVDWLTSTRSANAQIRQDLAPLRARARQLEEDNPYVKRFLKVTKRNVIGPDGIELEMQAVQDPGGEELDTEANKIIQDAWEEWSERGTCTMCGTLDLIAAANLQLGTMARDGESLTRRVRGRAAENRFNYAIHLIEPDYLDETIERVPSAESVIHMGVERNHWDRPLRYWLWQSHPGDQFMPRGGGHLVVDARDMLHNFLPDRLHQARGVSWLHAAATLLFQTDKAVEAEVVASRIAASKMAFYKPDGDVYEGEDEDDEGNLVAEVEPGIFEQLPAGMDVEAIDFQHPNANVPAFMKAMLKGAGSGLDMSYVLLGNDVEGVNYTSIRADLLEQRDAWRVLQGYEATHWYNVIFRDWLEMSLTSGALGRLPLSRFDKYTAGARWRPRGWEWVDPAKEVKAAVDAIDNLLNSRSNVMRQRGLRLREVWRQLDAENQLMAKHDLAPRESSAAAPVQVEVENG